MIIRFWDDLHINKRDCDIRLGRFERGDVALVHDGPLEKGGTIYHNITQLYDGRYMMYYMAIESGDNPNLRIGLIGSYDGVNWKDFNATIFDGLQHTNKLDNFFVFYDENTKSTKAVYQDGKKLRGVDGLNFQSNAHTITTEGAFDSLNTCFYDEVYECYRCYFRGFHNGIRDIRTIESKDFITWSKPRMLKYHGNPTDYQLYTNNIMPYEDIYIGLPTRYVERGEYNSNFTFLPERERRQKVINKELRFGTAMTDLLFMYSYNGNKWHRIDEAIMRPDNYVYGDCYMAYGYVGVDEHTFYMLEGHNTSKPCQLRRYTIKKNRFMSMHAGDKICTIKTKPLKLHGVIRMNFKTSAAGWVSIRVEGEEEQLVFGDSLYRPVLTVKGPKTASLTIRFKDADIYSLEG
jgi:hypothetical protein